MRSPGSNPRLSEPSPVETRKKIWQCRFCLVSQLPVSSSWLEEFSTRNNEKRWGD